MTLRLLVSLFAVGVSDIPETYGNDFYRQCEAYQSYFGEHTPSPYKDWGLYDWYNFDWYDWYYYWDWIDWYSSDWDDWYFYWDWVDLYSSDWYDWYSYWDWVDLYSSDWDDWYYYWDWVDLYSSDWYDWYYYWDWIDWYSSDWDDWYYYWDWVDLYRSDWYDWYYYWDEWYYYWDWYDWYSDWGSFDGDSDWDGYKSDWYSDWGSFDGDSDWNTDWDWYGDDSDWYSDNVPNTTHRGNYYDTSGNRFYNGLGPGTWPDFCDEYFRHHMNNSDNVDELYNATQTQSERDEGGETFVDQQTETFVDDENGGTAQSSTVGPGTGKPTATVDGEVVLSTVQSGKSLICSEANLAVNGGTWSILFDVLDLDGITATLGRLACHDQRRLDRILRRMQEVTFTVTYSVEFVDTDAAMVFTVRVASESTATATTFETEAATVLGVDVTASFPPPSMAVSTSEAVALVSACRGLPVIIPFLPLCSALW